MLKFDESDICKTRLNCIPCRREVKFRQQMEKKFKGPWECPLGIPIDAKDEQFPPEIFERFLEQKKQIEERQRIYQAAVTSFEELSMVLSGDNLARLESIRTAFLPQTKIASKCQNSVKQIGKIDQLCCGGTIKKVAAFDCSKHTICTDKKCHTCSDFTLKKEVK